jgi:hypothetical protein
MLINGDKLNGAQRKQVLEAFGYRWTAENKMRDEFWQGVRGKPTIPLTSDYQWLKEHAFHFTDDGLRLKDKPSYCEAVYSKK